MLNHNYVLPLLALLLGMLLPLAYAETGKETYTLTWADAPPLVVASESSDETDVPSMDDVPKSSGETDVPSMDGVPEFSESSDVLPDPDTLTLTGSDLCRRMNITLIEPERTKDRVPCCGGSSMDYDRRVQMANSRASELPLEDVVLYCTGCTRSFSVTRARPHHLLDLLFNEPTEGLSIKR